MSDKPKEDPYKKLADAIINAMREDCKESAKINRMKPEERVRYLEEKKELESRSKILQSKAANRDLITSIGLITMLVGMGTGLILFVVTGFLFSFSILGMFVDTLHWWLSNTLNYWIFAGVFFFGGYLAYRKVRPRDQKDVLRDAAEKTKEKLK